MLFFLKQKTAYERRISDWSSDVCSSDLLLPRFRIVLNGAATAAYLGAHFGPGPRDGLMTGLVRRTGRSVRLVRTIIEGSVLVRSEERRVGKGWFSTGQSWWATVH